ncbi:MAG: tRNA (adenosine(37)-N6)-threonylcarbamoyltransferase complex ATPase subunit type 1 TsaE [Nitrospirae bacterium]|nr:tRNA (adenosine(37)-N6)-threonylcarbamoyltransferase complex ATPase subunit type 1 TsaE [Nitrospirota bacterium]
MKGHEALAPPGADRSCQTDEETMALGEEVGRALRPGQVVALTGPLGAGKTVFVKGISRAFGLDPATITSPTFTFVHRHETGERGPLIHVDLFRAETPRELASIGLDEILNAGAIVVVEWAERAEAHLPADCMRVRIDYAAEGRRIRIENPHPSII